MLRSLLGCDRLQLTQVLVNCKPGPYHETPVEAGVKARLAKSYQKQHAGHSQKSSAERKMPCETKEKNLKRPCGWLGLWLPINSRHSCKCPSMNQCKCLDVVLLDLQTCVSVFVCVCVFACVLLLSGGVSIYIFACTSACPYIPRVYASVPCLDANEKVDLLIYVSSGCRFSWGPKVVCLSWFN